MSYFGMEWDKTDKESFGGTLRRVRNLKGFTQAKLAEKVGVLNTTISNYELGVSLPDYETLIKISKALNVDPGIFNVNWRICDHGWDVVPDIIQIQKDFTSGEFTRHFVYLINEYLYMNCQAYLVPEKYLKPGNNNINSVVVAPSLGVKDGRCVAVLANNDVYIGTYRINQNNEEILEPFTYFNPDVSEKVNLSEFGFYKTVGMIISCNSQFITKL